MDIIAIINLLISIGTFIIVIVKVIIKKNEKMIDRRIEVIIGERRRMQQELFKNVLTILQIGREVEYGKLLKDPNSLFHEVLSCRIGVWININRENSFSAKLRSECNQLAIWVSSALESSEDDDVELYNKAINKNTQHIWGLIDKYIEEEEKLIQSIMYGKREAKIEKRAN